MLGTRQLAELRPAAAPARAYLIEGLRPRLGELVPNLRLIAENLLGADSAIDFVGIEPSGRIVLVLIAEHGEDLEMVGRALAQRAWVEPRVRDWIQLAPNIGARPAAGVRVLLLCSSVGTQTEAAIASLGPEVVSLARYRCLRNGSSLEILLEPGDASAPLEATAAASQPEDSATRLAELPPFRTGLSDEDLGLTADERRSLE